MSGNQSLIRSYPRIEYLSRSRTNLVTSSSQQRNAALLFLITYVVRQYRVTFIVAINRPITLPSHLGFSYLYTIGIIQRYKQK
jgi:hypothetical protein